ncbi:MAG: alpha/beta hydrolase [Clostridia bacterium]|nr:alpha/beta hydrolase [Clostridia bacterium]
MRKFSVKSVLVFALVLVLVLSIGLVACDKKDSSPSTPVQPVDPVNDDPQPTVVDLDPNYDPNNHHKNAIIYVTALFGGGLYNKETNEPVWDPFYTEFDLYDHWAPTSSTIYDFGGVLGEFSEEMGDAFSTIMDALSFEEGTLLYDMTLDQDGNGLNPNVVAANINDKFEKPVDIDGEPLHCYYGAVAIYKRFITETRSQLIDAYGYDYDCLMFNQDFRKSPADSAAELEEFINSRGYQKVIFMSHSMGGPVVNSYLGRSKANRDKVELYMAFAPATLGSFDAFGAMTCPKDYLGAFLTTFGFNLEQTLADGGIVGGLVKSILDKIGIFFNNSSGMMALCPSYEFLNSVQLAGDSAGGLIVDGKKIGLCEDLSDPDAVEAAKNELYDFYNTLNWALYVDEDGKNIHYEDGVELDDDNLKFLYSANGQEIESGVARIVSGNDLTGKEVTVANYDAVAARLVDCNTLCVEQDGELIVALDVNGNPVLLNKLGDRIKYGAGRLKTYYSRLFVDGKIAMSPENGLNSYVFLGTNIESTNTGCIMTTVVDKDGNPVLDKNTGYPTYSCKLIHDDLAPVGEEGWIGGDGMVCTYASLAGMDMDMLDEMGHLIVKPDYWHADVGGAWPLLGADVIRLIDGVLNGKTK